MARQRFAKKIDFKQWSEMPGFGADISTAGTNAGGSLGFLAPATVLRCRGSVTAFMDATKQADDQIVVTFGLGLVSTDAVTAGAGSLPDPSGEPEYPWLWWGQLDLHSELAAAAEAWGISAQKMHVDTKAMRKVKPGQSLVWLFETTDLLGAPATHISIAQTRVLLGT